jgi:hypothetical protein
MSQQKAQISVIKKSLGLLIAAPLLIGLTGCVVAVGGNNDDGYTFNSDHDREYDNRKKIAQLQAGMSFVDVQNKLGVADFNESYKKNDEQIQVLFYRTQRLHEDGMTTKDECSPLIFKNGALSSWGDQAYSQL